MRRWDLKKKKKIRHEERKNHYFQKNELENIKHSCYIKEMKHQGAVAQLARATRSHRVGRGFDSHQLHHKKFSRSSSGFYFFMVEMKPSGFRFMHRQVRFMAQSAASYGEAVLHKNA